MYAAQLGLGIAAGLVWGLVFYRWSDRRTFGPRAQVAIIVSFSSALIILPFGSLRLLDVLDDTLWTITGTLLRIVLIISGLVALTDVRHPADGR